MVCSGHHTCIRVAAECLFSDKVVVRVINNLSIIYLVSFGNRFYVSIVVIIIIFTNQVHV